MGRTPRHISSNRGSDGTYTLESLPEFHRVVVTPTLAEHKPSDAAHRDVNPVAENLLRALEMREQYLWKRTTHQNEDPKLAQFDEDARRDPFTFRAAPCGDDVQYNFSIGATGVAEVKLNGRAVKEWAPPTLAAFSADLTWLYKVVCCGKAECTFAHKRLKMLEKNFKYSQEMNWSYEAEQIRFSRSDFRKIVKVDTHIHAASAFTRCELLDFMQTKLQDPHEALRIVATEDDKNGGLAELSLAQVLVRSGLSSEKEEMYRQLTVDRLNVAASAAMFHRFDNFNDSYNPMANPNLRAIFMKTENKVDGQYFAELMHVVFERLRSAKHDGAHCRIEPRLSIYGRSDTEWDKLARWFVNNKMLSLDPADGSSDDRVRWAVQIPRLYQVFCGKPLLSFGHLLRNIFEPLFEVTIDPSTHPDLHVFLMHVGFFDCVDDESVLDDLTLHDFEKFPPDKYSKENGCTTNPPYSYFIYHLYANLKVLNHLREAKGFNTFPLKPHAGEAGSRHHMATAFLLADSVNHGAQFLSKVAIIKDALDLFDRE